MAGRLRKEWSVIEPVDSAVAPAEVSCVGTGQK